MTFTGKAAKQLAGSGCLYVRLTRDIENADSDDSESLTSGIGDPDVTLLKVEPPPTSPSTPLPHPAGARFQGVSASSSRVTQQYDDLAQPATSGTEQVILR